MRISKTAPQDRGYDAPSTEHVTTDLAEWDTNNFWHVDDVQFSMIDPLPSHIIVRVKPSAIPLKKRKGIMVSFISQNTDLKAQPLYAKESLHHSFEHDVQSCQIAKINLHFENSEHAHILNFKEGDLVYEKPFALQTQSVVYEHPKNPSPGSTKVRKLYGYGGRYKEGLSLDECEQVFFEICQGYKKTEVGLSTYSQWVKRGTPPLAQSSFRKKTIEIEPHLTEEQVLNLGAALAGGYAKIQVEDPELGQTITYHSLQGDRPHNHPHLIDITFAKQESKDA